MSQVGWRRARWVGALVVLGVLVARMGGGPFLDGLRIVDGWTLAAATAITVPTTVCCAWRWRLVARGLGVGLPLRTAVLACYRSQFLNTALPGGVLGDVHRGVSHGREVGDTGRGLRAVAWERVCGQVVQAVMTAVVLLLFPSPLRSWLPAVGAGLAAAAGVVLVVVLAVPRGGTSLWSRAVRAARSDLRDVVLARRTWPGAALASALAVAGHVATFLIAARAAGVSASPERLVPLALLVMLAASIPMNVAGWGPREGVAAWAFAAAGLGAAQGVTTAVAYGVMAIAASLPGAAVLLVTWLRHDTAAPAERAAPPDSRPRAVAGSERPGG